MYIIHHCCRLTFAQFGEKSCALFDWCACVLWTLEHMGLVCFLVENETFVKHRPGLSLLMWYIESGSFHPLKVTHGDTITMSTYVNQFALHHSDKSTESIIKPSCFIPPAARWPQDYKLSYWEVRWALRLPCKPVSHWGLKPQYSVLVHWPWSTIDDARSLKEGKL